MRASLLKTLPALLLLALVGTACKDKALGSETAGKQIKAATGYRVVVIPPAKRKLRPSYSGEDLDGGRISSSELRGHVVVVNFWASWCGPCREEQPTLQKVWDEYKSKGVLFVGMNIRDRKADARAHIAEFGVTYPSIYNFDASLAAKFRVAVIPQTFIVDPNGRVAVKIFGATTKVEQLGKLLDTMLTAQAAAP